MIPYATNEEFYEWFFINADFGPASDDVMRIMFAEFEKQKNKAVPENITEGY